MTTLAEATESTGTPLTPAETPNVEKLLADLRAAQRRLTEESAIEQQIAKKERDISQTVAEIDKAKGKLKGLEGERDKLVIELRQAVRGDGNLFAQAMATPSPAETKPEAVDAWRSVTLEQLGITKHALVEKLAQEGIVDLGTLEDWRGARDRKKIAGLGPAAEQKLDDAVVKYWAEHPPKEEAVDAVPPAPPVIPVSDLGLTKEDLRTAFHPMLPTVADGGGPTQLDGVLTLPQPPETVDPNVKWIALSGHLGVSDYRLLPLNSIDDDRIGRGAHFGKVVQFDGTMYRVGSEDDAIHVKVEDEPPAEESVQAIEADKSKRSKRRRKAEAAA